MDRNESLINGPGVQPPVSVNAPVPRDVAGDALRQGVAQVGQNIGGVFREMVETEDSTKQFDQERILMQMQSEVDREAKRRLQLPDGDPEAFFDERGNLSQVALKDFTAPYLKTLKGIGSGILNPDRARKMQMKAALMGDKMVSGLMDSGFEVAKQKQETALNSSLKLAKETNNWGWYEELVHEGVKSGAIDSAKGNLLLFRGGKTASLQNFNNLAATNPAGAYDLLWSEEYRNKFSPAELEEMRRRLAIGRDKASHDFFRSFVLTVPESSDKKKRTNELAQSGNYTAQEIRWGVFMQAGKGGEVIDEIRAAAIAEARAFNPSLSDEGMELAREKYIDKYLGRYESAGITKEFLNRQWSEAEKIRKTLKTPDLDVDSRLDLLEKRGALLNQGAFNAENQPYSDKEGWESGGKFRDEFMGQLGLAGTEDAEKAMSKYMAYARAVHADGLRAQIKERFNSWRGNEGKEATQAEQQVKLISLTREITGNSNVYFEDEGPSLMDQAREWSYRAQQNKFDVWKTKQGEVLELSGAQQQEPLQRVSVGFDTTRKDLPDGILLPRSMMEGVKEGEDAVVLTYDNKHLKVARVVGVCEGDTPQLTYAAARRGNYNLNKSYELDMHILRESEARPLLEAQEAAVPAGKAVKLKNETSLKGLLPYKQAFMDSGQKYGVDPKLLMAISMHESDKGTSPAFLRKNNAMGISPNGGGPRAFASVEESIDYAARLLKKHYLDNGLTTIAAIGGKYAPAGAGNDPRGLNKHWIQGVSRYYNSL